MNKGYESFMAMLSSLSEPQSRRIAMRVVSDHEYCPVDLSVRSEYLAAHDFLASNEETDVGRDVDAEISDLLERTA